MPILLQLSIAFFYGSVLGSFLGVVLSRVPGMARHNPKSVLLGLCYPPSTCPHCRHRIRWFENIPVWSYLLLRGKCSSCQAAIPADHLLVEIGFGVLAALFWWLVVL